MMTCSRGCCATQREHWLSVSISPSAMPTRRDVRYSATDKLEKGWHKDIPAYKRLVKEGLQPNSVDGAAQLEARADTKEQVEDEHFEPIVEAS